MIRSQAEILREYGPFPGVDHVHGVTFDGQHVWFASGDKLNALDPASGKTLRSIDVVAHAGTRSTASTCFRSPRIASGVPSIADHSGQASYPTKPPSAARPIDYRLCGFCLHWLSVLF